MRRRLGQGGNRLENVRVGAILSRRILHPEFLNQLRGTAGALTPFQKSQISSQITSIPDFQILDAVRQNPSAEEIQTLGIVDGFMGPLSGNEFEALWGFHTGISPAFLACGTPQWMLAGEQRGFATTGGFTSVPAGFPSEYAGIQPISTDPFYCPSIPDFPLSWLVSYPGPGIESIGGSPMFPVPLNPHARFWRIWLGQPLSEHFAYIPNMVEIERVLETYPFPEPFKRDYSFILARHIVPGLRQFARTPAAISETAVRMWLTFEVLSKWEAMSLELEEYLEDQADNARRRKITMLIGGAAVGALLGLAALPAMVTKGFAAISGFASRQDQANVAQDIQKASDAFQTQDPAFAAEVARTAEIMRKLSEDGNPNSQNALADGGGLGVIEIAGIGVAGLALAFLLGAFD